MSSMALESMVKLIYLLRVRLSGSASNEGRRRVAFVAHDTSRSCDSITVQRKKREEVREEEGSSTHANRD